MPLFSSSENTRAREQEYKRRQDLSKLIASLVEQVTKRNLSIRMIALYESLERREQIRVGTGGRKKPESLVTVADQVKYLEKVAIQYQHKYEAIADIDAIRLQLVAHCADDKAFVMDKWLLAKIDNI